MTDVTVAPDGGAAPSAAPSNEVAINPSPVNAPNPLSDQGPEKPPGSDTDHRRSAIERAFERAANPQPKPDRQAAKPAAEAKPADAKPGHNRPPPDKEVEEPLDLKKRPSDQPRGERGQFAPREPQGSPPGSPGSPQVSGSPAPGSPQVRGLPATAPYREPPPRMADHAKAEWAAAPESVRGEVHRMNQEFEKAYQRYRSDHEAMNPIRHFAEMATQHGTTLDRALSNYVGMEQKLRQDVVGGLDVIVNNLNLRAADGSKIGLRDVAYHILNMSPDQHRLTQAQNATSAQTHQIGALHQELAGLKSTLQEMHTAAQFQQTRGAVDQFADAHPRFDELGDLIEHELKFGFDLETAYRRAELLRPATHAAQTRTPSAQTRPTDRSISGAPDAGPSNGTSRRSQKPVGRRDAIQNAINRVNGNGAL